VAPLRAAEDAVYIDSTKLDAQQVFDLVEAMLSVRVGDQGPSGERATGSASSAEGSEPQAGAGNI